MKTKIVFVFSLSLLSFFLGAAVIDFKFFPYSYLNEAKLAAIAHFKVFERKRANKPVMFLKKQNINNFSNTPVSRNAIHPDSSLFLMTGGPYQLTSHCPEYGCLAWITDRLGNIKHTWPLNADKLWSTFSLGRWASIDDIYPVGLHLFPNGDLLATFQVQNNQYYSIAIVKFDKNGNIIWKSKNRSHHWFSLDDSGKIYVPGSKKIEGTYLLGKTQLSLKCNSKILDGIIRILNSNGKQIDEISLIKSLTNSGYAGVLHTSTGTTQFQNCDILHLNDTKVLTKAMASQYPGLTTGDILVSARNINTLAIIDSVSHKIKWLSQGQTVGQHSPHFIGSNKILVFDNKGGTKGLSQIVTIDIDTHKKEIIAPKPKTQGAKNFSSIIAGHVELSENKKRLLVTLSTSARVFEIDIQTEKIIWSYLNSHQLPEKFYFKKDEELITSGLFHQWAAYYANNTHFDFNQE